MNVKLIAITKPVISDCENASELIAYCGRVSNPANQGNTETAPKLIKYLAEHKHWSPFEMASMTIEIVTTRDIARQILRHRSFSFQEFSQRYAEVTAPPVLREARLQDAKNRQASLVTDDSDLHKWWNEAQANLAMSSEVLYKDAIGKGIAKEVARCVLPEGMTESRLYMAGTIRSFIHYIVVRTGNETQLEHRDIAFGIKNILLTEFDCLGEIL